MYASSDSAEMQLTVASHDIDWNRVCAVFENFVSSPSSALDVGTLCRTFSQLGLPVTTEILRDHLPDGIIVNDVVDHKLLVQWLSGGSFTLATESEYNDKDARNREATDIIPITLGELDSESHSSTSSDPGSGGESDGASESFSNSESDGAPFSSLRSRQVQRKPSFFSRRLSRSEELQKDLSGVASWELAGVRDLRTRTTKISKQCVTVAAPDVVVKECAKYEFEELQLHPDYRIYDINFYNHFGDANPQITQALRNYFNCCTTGELGNLFVTTSCFSAWRKAQKSNSAGKIIPAIPESTTSGLGEHSRIIFFDDNINLHLNAGASLNAGICNLRNIDTGEYVDFTAGKNGFMCERLFRYTFVTRSCEYRNVLVEANILDAMTNVDYFNTILCTCCKPNEKLFVIVDINGTIVWDDSISSGGLSTAECLLNSMFKFTEVWPQTPGSAAEITWKTYIPVSLDRRQDLRSFVQLMCGSDKACLNEFWNLNNCEGFLEALTSVAYLGRLQDENHIEVADFLDEYRHNLDLITQSVSVDGIPKSWFRCFEFLMASGHAVVLNSFGVDTFRVLNELCIGSDPKSILQLTVNYKMWSERDRDVWNSKFDTCGGRVLKKRDSKARRNSEERRHSRERRNSDDRRHSREMPNLKDRRHSRERPNSKDRRRSSRELKPEVRFA